MKIYLFLLSAFLLSGQLSAQGMPVYDNTNFLTLGKQLIESGKQTSQLIQTVKFLKEQKERLDRVNAVVRDLKLIREIVDDHKTLHTEIRREFRQLGSSPLLRNQELQILSAYLEGAMAQSMDDLELIRELLQHDRFKMTDKDRIDLLQQRRRRMDQVKLNCEAQVRRYRAMIDFRKMVEAANTKNKL